MFALISLGSGIMLEAIVVQSTPNRMRLVAPEFSDALELKRRGHTWWMEGRAVQFEFLSAARANEHSPTIPVPMARKAGSA